MLIPNTLNLGALDPASRTKPAIESNPDTPALQAPTKNTGRAAGDYRSVDEITQNPLFEKSLPTTSYLGSPLLEEDRLESFYEKVGGNWNDKSLSDRERADIAANAERVLEFIDNLGVSNSIAGNQKIDGIQVERPRLHYQSLTNEHLSVPFSEANLLLNFAQYGYRTFEPA